MSRILLADDSPHAQRMGEFILREEGFEVVTVTDGETAIIRLADVDPDVVLADISLPERNGYDVCRFIKSHSRFHHVRVVLTAGALELFEEEQARSAQADANLRKPFEASSLLETVKPLVEAARSARGSARSEAPPPAVEVTVPLAPIQPEPLPLVPDGLVDPERVRAAVTLALDAALPGMIDEITQRVLVALER